MPKQTIEAGTRVWKKAVREDDLRGTWGKRSRDYALIELEVLEPGFIADYEDVWGERFGVKNNHLKKGRVRSARVISITDKFGNPLESALSAHTADTVNKFRYTVGMVAAPTEPFDERNIACSSGIHCFVNKSQAEIYDF